ncbi:hypothetical protein BDFG_09222 [Blastomyces dermatitidis ATCC 26199]|nr:hypothetical protein BDFG_09222 [Blastomyces dermatitidis ATCC 26199]
MVMNKKRGKGKREERGSLPCTVCVSRHWLLGYELVPLHLRVLLFRSQKNSKKPTGEKKSKNGSFKEYCNWVNIGQVATAVGSNKILGAKSQLLWSTMALETQSKGTFAK